MQKYGKIQSDGNISLSSEQLDSYKPIKYGDMPEFDQTTHYVVEDVADKGEYILVEYQLNQLDLQEDEPMEHQPPTDGPVAAHVPTEAERLEALEGALLMMMMEG
jgi:hypothetical protein